jgi:hypothetical protein
MNGQAAGATSVHIVNLGSLYVGNAGSDCCFVLTLTTTYDRSTGYTSLSLGFVYTGSTKSGPSPCPGASDPVSATIAYHSDNVGHASIAGGRKTNNEFVGIGLTSAAGTVGDWDFSGVTVVINGTDPSACAPQTCTGPTPPTPPTCSKYAVYICCFNISTNTYTVKVNGTTIGTFTTSGSQNPSHVEVFATASGITYDVLFDSGDPCGTSSTHGPSTINNSVISSPFTSGANTIEIDLVGVDDEGVDEFLVQVLKTTSAGVICDTLLSNGSDFPDSSSTQLFAFPFYA